MNYFHQIPITIKQLVVLCFTFILSVNLIGQESPLYHFQFTLKNKKDIHHISRIISIDNVNGTTIEAYANKDEMLKFKALNIEYELIHSNKASKAYTMASTINEMANWDKYPTYEVYELMMNEFASNFPSICQLEEISTLSSNRKILALKISDNVNNNDEPEPEILYTASMHGDETAGYILLLRLSDYLLNNYNKTGYEQITKLINSTEIWINPLANPNGTYYGGNNNISNAIRTNSQLVDLNRNFPDPQAGDHPDGNIWQEETQAMMTFAGNHNFILSANFHGGAELLNYPWDTWSKATADEAWWLTVCNKYRDSAQANSPIGYFTDFNNGVTNGYKWYYITGGRQDYMNYFHHCRELTVELSGTKIIPSEELNNYWNYNKSALINYLSEALNSIHGVVKNKAGVPLKAKIEVINHDIDNSHIYTDINAGNYTRLINQGIYNIRFSADGYTSKIKYGVNVKKGQKTTLNVELGNGKPEIKLSKANINTEVFKGSKTQDSLFVYNIGTEKLNVSFNHINDVEKIWWQVTPTTANIEPNDSLLLHLSFDSKFLDKAIYNTNMQIYGDTNISLPIELNVYTLPLITKSIDTLNVFLFNHQTYSDSIILKNKSNKELNFSSTIKNASQNQWVNIEASSTIIPIGGESKILVNYLPKNVPLGKFNTWLLLDGDIKDSVYLSLHADTLPQLTSDTDSIYKHLFLGQNTFDTIKITNSGGDSIHYQISLEYEDGDQWLNFEKTSGLLTSGKQDELVYLINTVNLDTGIYKVQIHINGEDSLSVPFSLQVSKTPELTLNTYIFNIQNTVANFVSDTLILNNIGKGELPYNIHIEYHNDSNWVQLNKDKGILNTQQSDTITLTFGEKNLSLGTYTATLIINTDKEFRIPITMSILEPAQLVVYPKTLLITLPESKSTTEQFTIQNTGGIPLNYNFGFKDGKPNWINLNSDTSGILNANNFLEVDLEINAINLELNTYNSILFISDKDTTIELDITLRVITNIENKAPPSTISVYPNPFNENIKIVINTSNKNSTLSIYNILGKKIIDLKPNLKIDSQIEFTWNGCNSQNLKVPNGTYFFKLNSNEISISGKIQKI